MGGGASKNKGTSAPAPAKAAAKAAAKQSTPAKATIIPTPNAANAKKPITSSQPSSATSSPAKHGPLGAILERTPTKKKGPTAEECYARAITLLHQLSTAASMLAPSSAAAATLAAGGGGVAGHRRGLTTGILPAGVLRGRTSSDANNGRPTTPGTPPTNAMVHPGGSVSADDVLAPSPSPNPKSNTNAAPPPRRQPLRPGMSASAASSNGTGNLDRPIPSPTPSVSPGGLRSSQSRPAEPNEAQKQIDAEEADEREAEERIAKEAADANAAYARHASGLMDQVIEQLQSCITLGGEEYKDKVSQLLQRERLNAKIKHWQGLEAKDDDRHHIAAAAAPLVSRDADTEASAGVVPGALALAARAPHWSLKLTALMLSSYYGNDKQVQSLLALDRSPNHTNVDVVDGSEGMSALMFAAIGGHVDVFKTLRNAGAAYNIVNKQGHDVLRVAVLAQQAKIVKVMFELRFNTTEQKTLIRSNDGRSPLHIAAQYGYIGVVRALCNQTMIPLEDRTPLPEGATPLIIAVRAGHLVVARELLLHSADPNAATGAPTVNDGHHDDGHGHTTPSTPVPPLPQGLPTTATGDGNTPLHIAASLGQVIGIRLLWAWGGDLTIRNAAGRTPLEVATAHGRTRTTQQCQFLAEKPRPRDPGLIVLDELAPLPPLLPKKEDKKLVASQSSIASQSSVTHNSLVVPGTLPVATTTTSSAPSSPMPKGMPLSPQGVDLAIDVPPGNGSLSARSTATSNPNVLAPKTTAKDDAATVAQIDAIVSKVAAAADADAERAATATETKAAPPLIVVLTPRSGPSSSSLADVPPLPLVIAGGRPTTPSVVSTLTLVGSATTTAVTPSTIVLTSSTSSNGSEEKRPSTSSSSTLPPGSPRQLRAASDRVRREETSPSALSPRTMATVQLPTPTATTIAPSSIDVASSATDPTSSPPGSARGHQARSPGGRPLSSARLRAPGSNPSLDGSSNLSPPSVHRSSLGSGEMKEEAKKVARDSGIDLIPSPRVTLIGASSSVDKEKEKIRLEYQPYLSTDGRFERPSTLTLSDEWKSQQSFSSSSVLSPSSSSSPSRRSHEPYWASVLRDHTIQTAEWNAMRELVTPLLKDMIERQTTSINRQAMYTLVGKPFVDKHYGNASSVWQPQLLEPPSITARQHTELLQRLQHDTMQYILDKLPSLIDASLYAAFGQSMMNTWTDMIASASAGQKTPRGSASGTAMVTIAPLSTHAATTSTPTIIHIPARPSPVGAGQPIPSSPAAALIDLCQANPTARTRLKALSGCALPVQLRNYVWNLSLMDSLPSTHTTTSSSVLTSSQVTLIESFVSTATDMMLPTLSSSTTPPSSSSSSLGHIGIWRRSVDLMTEFARVNNGRSGLRETIFGVHLVRTFGDQTATSLVRPLMNLVDRYVLTPTQTSNVAAASVRQWHTDNDPPASSCVVDGSMDTLCTAMLIKWMEYAFLTILPIASVDLIWDQLFIHGWSDLQLHQTICVGLLRVWYHRRQDKSATTSSSSSGVSSVGGVTSLHMVPSAVIHRQLRPLLDAWRNR